MYSSLEEWCIFPIELYTRSGNTAGGDPKYLPPVTVQGYLSDYTKVITNKYGKEYVSMSRIYLPADVVITLDDMISTPGTSKREIQAVSKFYDGETGEVSIQVVYL